MDPRSWSTRVAWLVVVGLFVLVNVLRALSRSLLLPEHARLVGLIGVLLLLGWLAFAVYVGIVRGWDDEDRKRASNRSA